MKAHARLREKLAAGWELVDASGLVEGLRLVKEPGEIALIAAACALADEALTAVLEDGLAGRTEREVAFELEMSMRRLGAEALELPLDRGRGRARRAAARRSRATWRSLATCS